MNHELILLIATVMFVVYCSSESLANVPRHAGAITSHFPLGLMLANQVYSLNRLNGFLIAPILGFFVDSGGSEALIKEFAVAGCLLSALLILCILRFWGVILNIFVKFIYAVEENGFSLRAAGAIFHGEKRISLYSLQGRRKDLLILFAQSFTTSLAMPTAFILNILAIRYPSYQASLVQSATVISGVGNMILNFYISPRIALSETKGNADHMYYSVMLGKVVGVGIFSTCIIVII